MTTSGGRSKNPVSIRKSPGRAPRSKSPEHSRLPRCRWNPPSASDTGAGDSISADCGRPSRFVPIAEPPARRAGAVDGARSGLSRAWRWYAPMIPYRAPWPHGLPAWTRCLRSPRSWDPGRRRRPPHATPSCAVVHCMRHGRRGDAESAPSPSDYPDRGGIHDVPLGGSRQDPESFGPCLTVIDTTAAAERHWTLAQHEHTVRGVSLSMPAARPATSRAGRRAARSRWWTWIRRPDGGAS
jgi:hypothetical protein